MSGLFTAIAGFLLYGFYWLHEQLGFETLGWILCGLLVVLNLASGWVLYKRSKGYDN